MSTSAQAIPGLIELGRKNQAGGYVGNRTQNITITNPTMKKAV